MDNLLHILGILFDVLLCFRLFFPSQRGMASSPFLIIEPYKMRGFPCIKPVIDRQPLDIKNVHKIRRCPTLETEENTVGTWPDPMMLTFFITSLEQTLGLRTE